jgi:4-hydroxy-2-oxoheptanedioate aldolase
MPFTNPLRTAWDGGEATFGAWCSIPSSLSAELVANAGYDYVCVDTQHGAIGYSDALTMLQAAALRGAAPVVRVTWNDPAEIMKALDAGALGVIVPLVSTAEEAARAVAACRYPPKGIRSFGPIRASLVAGSRDPADLDQVVCIVMVETAEGLANVEEIAATPGLDGIYIGPSDLSLAVGLPPAYEQTEPAHVDAVERIRAACEAHGIVAGMHCAGGAMAARRHQQGFRMITVGADGVFLSTTAAKELATAREGKG